ncbi:oxygenase MpaB family protein [Sphingopyxis sp.]|uniref:oxygenase MpaB family protein n=1 Tax=Sphingopyxis sp. TaxID=1908224 RepID=UPI002DE4D994|nr:oxygenase MpaB family protein [Sphingopyxis sp.]
MRIKTPIAELKERVRAQAHAAPSIYGAIDFDTVPERYTELAEDRSYLSARYAHDRVALLADRERLDLIKAYTMLGDSVADSYAALMRQYGFRPLVDMLVQACDKGVEAVADAPPELVAFIRDMERVPDWLDMALVEKGARIERNPLANFGPFVIRGALFATFMNKYAALPMAITNTLSGETSARRVKETATFFTTTALPGALERFGPGFKAAAMVRLMHSMVRANVMRRPKDWDSRIFGIPIPQLDQMPAGLFGVFLMSYAIIDEGRDHFTADERARVEFARYRCFLLGLPEDLLEDTPQGIVNMMTARAGTLRAGFDDNTCGALVRATMAADLRPDGSLKSRIFERFERSFSKMFFMKNFMAGSRERASAVGVRFTTGDSVRASLAGIWVFGKIGLYRALDKIPSVRNWADRRLVAKLKRQLGTYGHAEFTTDASNYRPASTEAVPASA